MIYTPEDALGTIKSLGGWWSEITGGQATEWAIPHLNAQRSALLAFQPRLAQHDVDDPLSGAARMVAVLGRSLGTQSGWFDAQAESFLAHSLSLIALGGAAKREHVTLPAAKPGRVHQLAVSLGGVPKQAIHEADVGLRGIVGDRQATRRHHGRPWQALCIWSLEQIDAFAAEGHPIAPGSAGENVTISGVDWVTVTAGRRLAIGEVLVEVSQFSPPCAQNARWFSDGDFGRMHHSRGPGASRVYASVITPGRVSEGAPVSIT